MSVQRMSLNSYQLPPKLQVFNKMFSLKVIVRFKTYTKQHHFRLDKSISELLPSGGSGNRKPGATISSTHERQNANLSTKWLTWSFLRSASRSIEKALLLLSGRYFLHCKFVTERMSSYVLFRTSEDSISPRTRRRSMAQISKSSRVISSRGGTS